MNMQDFFRAGAAAIAVVAIFAGTGCKLANNAGKDETGRESGPVAKVTVAPLQKKNIQEELTVYGAVAAAPGAAQSLSVPFQCRVLKALVAPGQTVRKGAGLIEIEPGPDALLEYRQAKSESDSSAKELKLTKERFDLKLATKEDLVSAEQKAQAAKLQVQSRESRGINQKTLLASDDQGVVSRVIAQQGQLVPAGEPLLEIVSQEQTAVRLGVEDDDKDHVQNGQTVELFPVNSEGAKPVIGRVSSVGRQLNPETRLVDVFVTLPKDSGLLLNAYIRAVIVIASAKTLVAPRSAVLPEEGDYVLFTVEGGRAVKHIVRIGLQNKLEVEVTAEGLKEGQQVVTLGNSVLTDGMSVEALTGK
jgi:membrane fusion protein, multidrug efflux system